MKAYSIEFREKIIKAYEKVSVRFNVSKAFANLIYTVVTGW